MSHFCHASLAPPFDRGPLVTHGGHSPRSDDRPRSSENVGSGGLGALRWTPDFDEQNLKKPISMDISMISKVMWSQRWNFWFMILPFIHFDHRNMYDMNWPFINSCHKKIMSKFCLDIFLPCSFRVDLMKHSGDTNNLWRQFLVGYSCGEFIHSVWMHAKKSWFNPGSSLLIVSP